MADGESGLPEVFDGCSVHRVPAEAFVEDHDAFEGNTKVCPECLRENLEALPRVTVQAVTGSSRLDRDEDELGDEEDPMARTERIDR